MKRELISVCMATYNGEKYLKEQINSILMQLNDDDEIVISDDGSTDKTISIINEFNDGRIKLFHHKKEKQKTNFGYVAKNFENALSKASGDIIYLADQDDVWLPNKIENQNLALKKSDLVLSDCKIVDESLNVIFSSKFELENIRIGFWKNIYKSGYLGCCMAFRKEILKHILPIPKNVPHDLWIGLIGGDKYKFALLSVQTMLYRRHGNNVSATNPVLVKKEQDLPKNKNTLFFKLWYRFYTIKAYIWSKFMGMKLEVVKSK